MHPHTTHPDPSLPPDLESLIARAVKRARLRRSEREDVARELRSHFAAALAEGRTAGEAARDFGDPKAAGRLIGRAKRRCRSPIWHAWVWSCRGMGALLALLLVTYAWAAWAYYGAEPTITRNYLKEINDPIRALDPSECALPEYEAVYFSFTQADVERMRAALGRDASDPDGRAWAMQQLRPHFPRIRAAAERPHLGWVLVHDSRVAYHNPSFDFSRSDEARRSEAVNDVGLLDVLLTPLSLFWVFTPALHLDLEAALDRCDAQPVIADARAIVEMCGHMHEMGFAIAHLNGIAHASRLLETVRTRVMSGACDWQAPDLRGLAHALAPLRRLALAPLEFERLAFMDVNQRFFSAGPLGPAILNAAAFDSWRQFSKLRDLKPGMVLSRRGDERYTETWDPAAALVSATQAEALRFTEELFRHIDADARSRPWEVDELQAGAWLQRFDEGSLAARRLWFSRAMAFESAEQITRTWRFAAELDATLAVLAAGIFHREHGRWPASWDELVPSYLPEAPIDMFTGDPLRISERDGVWFVYSVGVDRKDDGGVPPEDPMRLRPAGGPGQWRSRSDIDALTPQLRRALDGDWILWPQIDPDTGEFVYTSRE